MKQDRLHYLLSRCNIYYLNELDRLQQNGRYKKIIGIEYIPKQLRGSEKRIKSFLILFGLLLPLFVLFCFFKATLSHARTKRIVYNSDYLFLLVSPALPRVVKRAELETEKGKWLLYPWKDNDCIPSESKLSVFSLLNLYDILDSIVDYIRTYYYVWYKEGLNRVPLVIGSLNWFLYNSALRHVSSDTNLIFCNHLDQLVVLIDKLPHRNKILVQHGTEIILHNTFDIEANFLNKSQQGFWTLNPPYQYHTITEAYVFTKTEETALLLSILGCHPKFHYTGYGLKLTDLNLEKKSVLIVGYYYIFIEIERKILESLQDKGLVVFLKNHPTIPPSKYDSIKKEYDFELITDGTFPKVDLVISYDSTLALEYEALGVSVLYYDNINFSNKQTVEDAIRKGLLL